jgi:hypothetical protein
MSMGKTTAKPITQYCIKSHFFNEVIKLPKEVKIVSINFEIGWAMKRMSQNIPQNMAGCGVTYACKTDPSMEVTGKLVGSRKNMSDCIDLICAHYGLNPKTVRVKRMEVATGNNDKHLGVFHRMTKKITGDDGKISQIRVLGLIKWDTDEIAIARAVQAHPYKCKFTTQAVRTVMCEEG